MQCWEKFNNCQITTAPSNHQKYFIKIIISTIIAQLQSCNIEQYVRNYANWEIVLLQCGIDNMRYISYLNSKLTGYLRKMNDKKIVRKEYTEMVCLANNIYLIIVWHNINKLYFILFFFAA